MGHLDETEVTRNMIRPAEDLQDLAVVNKDDTKRAMLRVQVTREDKGNAAAMVLVNEYIAKGVPFPTKEGKEIQLRKSKYQLERQLVNGKQVDSLVHIETGLPWIFDDDLFNEVVDFLLVEEEKIEKQERKKAVTLGEIKAHLKKSYAIETSAVDFLFFAPPALKQPPPTLPTPYKEVPPVAGKQESPTISIGSDDSSLARAMERKQEADAAAKITAECLEKAQRNKDKLEVQVAAGQRTLDKTADASLTNAKTLQDNNEAFNTALYKDRDARLESNAADFNFNSKVKESARKKKRRQRMSIRMGSGQTPGRRWYPSTENRMVVQQGNPFATPAPKNRGLFDAPASKNVGGGLFVQGGPFVTPGPKKGFFVPPKTKEDSPLSGVTDDDVHTPEGDKKMPAVVVARKGNAPSPGELSDVASTGSPASNEEKFFTPEAEKKMPAKMPKGSDASMSEASSPGDDVVNSSPGVPFGPREDPGVVVRTAWAVRGGVASAASVLVGGVFGSAKKKNIPPPRNATSPKEVAAAAPAPEDATEKLAEEDKAAVAKTLAANLDEPEKAPKTTTNAKEPKTAEVATPAATKVVPAKSSNNDEMKAEKAQKVASKTVKFKAVEEDVGLTVGGPVKAKSPGEKRVPSKATVAPKKAVSDGKENEAPPTAAGVKPKKAAAKLDVKQKAPPMAGVKPKKAAAQLDEDRKQKAPPRATRNTKKINAPALKEEVAPGKAVMPQKAVEFDEDDLDGLNDHQKTKLRKKKDKFMGKLRAELNQGKPQLKENEMKKLLNDAWDKAPKKEEYLAKLAQFRADNQNKAAGKSEANNLLEAKKPTATSTAAKKATEGKNKPVAKAKAELKPAAAAASDKAKKPKPKADAPTKASAAGKKEFEVGDMVWAFHRKTGKWRFGELVQATNNGWFHVKVDGMTDPLKSQGQKNLSHEKP